MLNQSGRSPGSADGETLKRLIRVIITSRNTNKIRDFGRFGEHCYINSGLSPHAAMPLPVLPHRRIV